MDDTGSQNIEAGLRLASALLNFWHTQNFQNEGSAWLKKGLSALPINPADLIIRAKACFATGHLVLALGRTAEARKWIEESLSIYKNNEDISGVVMAQSLLGEICGWSDAFDQAKELGATSLAICRTLNDPWLLAWVLCRYGTSIYFHGEPIMAQSLFEESLGIFEQLGDSLQVGDLYLMLGEITFEGGDFTNARIFNGKGLAAARAMQSKWTEANALQNLSFINYIEGDYQQMQNELMESVALKRAMGHPYLWNALLPLAVAEINLAHPDHALLYFKELLRMTIDPVSVPVSLIGIARVSLQTNHILTAAQLLGAAKHWLSESYHLSRLIERIEYERGWAEIKDRLGEPGIEQAISEGEALALNEAVALALSLDI